VGFLRTFDEGLLSVLVPYLNLTEVMTISSANKDTLKLFSAIDGPLWKGLIA
jgi:hypothetical protein